MAFFLRHNLSKSSLSDLLQLFSLLVPSLLTKNRHLFERNFEVKSNAATLHYYCDYCSSYLGESEGMATCKTCNRSMSTKDLEKKKIIFFGRVIRRNSSETFLRRMILAKKYLRKVGRPFFWWKIDLRDIYGGFVPRRQAKKIFIGRREFLSDGKHRRRQNFLTQPNSLCGLYCSPLMNLISMKKLNTSSYAVCGSVMQSQTSILFLNPLQFRLEGFLTKASNGKILLAGFTFLK